MENYISNLILTFLEDEAAKHSNKELRNVTEMTDDDGKPCLFVDTIHGSFKVSIEFYKTTL
jgi:hypothetical protein